MGAPPTVWSQLVSSKVYLLMIHVFLWIFSVGLMFPHITSIANNYFASRISGDTVVCEAYVAPDVPPPDCQEGSAEAVKWLSWTSFVSNAICAFTIVPLIGWLSDRYGRKPFLVLGQVLTMLPSTWTFLYLRHPKTLPYWGVYPLDAVRGCVNPVSLCLSYTADVITPEARSIVFGLILAMLSLGTIFASVTGYLIGPLWSSLLVLVGLATSAVFVICVIPESLTAVAKDRALSQSAPKKAVGLEGLLASYRIVSRSPLFARLAALMAISGMIFECLKDVLLLYLMNVLGFRQQETATLFVVMGVSGLATQTLVLPALLHLIGEKWVLYTALVCSTLEMALLAGASQVWMAYIAVLVGAGGSMAFPAISAISSANSQPDEQGAVQGALYGMRGLAQGIGPLIFSAAYTWSIQDNHYAPSLPLVGATVIMFGGSLIALSIKVPAGTDAAAQQMEVEGSLLQMPETERLLPVGAVPREVSSPPGLSESGSGSSAEMAGRSMDRRADSFGIRRKASMHEERR